MLLLYRLLWFSLIFWTDAIKGILVILMFWALVIYTDLWALVKLCARYVIFLDPKSAEEIRKTGNLRGKKNCPSDRCVRLIKIISNGNRQFGHSSVRLREVPALMDVRFKRFFCIQNFGRVERYSLLFINLVASQLVGWHISIKNDL